VHHKTVQMGIALRHIFSAKHRGTADSKACASSVGSICGTPKVLISATTP